jgi:hypothetical protein
MANPEWKSFLFLMTKLTGGGAGVTNLPFYDNNNGSVIRLTITKTGLGRTIAANLTFSSGFGWANTPTVRRFLRYATLGASQQDEEQTKKKQKQK